MVTITFAIHLWWIVPIVTAFFAWLWYLCDWDNMAILIWSAVMILIVLASILP